MSAPHSKSFRSRSNTVFAILSTDLFLTSATDFAQKERLHDRIIGQNLAV